MRITSWRNNNGVKNILSVMIVVTGASGFLGGAVLNEIENRGLQPVGIGGPSQADPADGRFMRLDLAESSDLLARSLRDSRAEALIHAALPAREAFEKDPAGSDSRIERIDRNVIMACAESPNLRTVILVSSSAVYGPLKTTERSFSETRPPEPAAHYGRSKLAQEKRWSGAPLNARLVIARVFNITGPHEPASNLGGAFARRLAGMSDGASIPLRNSESVRDFSDVRDTAAGIVSLTTLRTPVPPVINICSGIGTIVSNFARMILEASGRDITLVADGQGKDSRSVGDSSLFSIATGLSPKFTLEESAAAVWTSTAQSFSQQVPSVSKRGG